MTAMKPPISLFPSTANGRYMSIAAPAKRLPDSGNPGDSTPMTVWGAFSMVTE
jgi:hypothetical protein